MIVKHTLFYIVNNRTLSRCISGSSFLSFPPPLTISCRFTVSPLPNKSACKLAHFMRNHHEDDPHLGQTDRQPVKPTTTGD